MTKLASLEDGHNVAPKSASNGSSPVGNFLFQVKLLLWKRYLESTKSKWDLLKVLLPAVLFFILMILLYAVFDFFAAGAIEPFLVPLAFWIYIQRIVVQIMFEKSSRLQESMRMMGLSDVAYYTSYFISDGVILGFLLSFLVTLFTVGGLFNGANFGVILGFLFVFCLSAIPFAFFVCAFFDTPQTSGQATLGILFGTSTPSIHNYFARISYFIYCISFIGFFIIYIVVFTVDTATISLKAAETLCCFIPPIALQIGAGSFLKSHEGITISEVSGILVRIDFSIHNSFTFAPYIDFPLL